MPRTRFQPRDLVTWLGRFEQALRTDVGKAADAVGELRAHLDGELTADEAEEAAHVAKLADALASGVPTTEATSSAPSTQG